MKFYIHTFIHVTQALLLCEEDDLDKKAQRDGIMLIVSVVEQLTCLGEENLNTISEQLIASCSELAEKPDQCRGIALCAHLFWSGKMMSESSSAISQVSICNFHREF